MSAARAVARVLIVAGMVGFSFGAFSHPKETYEVRLDPTVVSVEVKQGVNVPVWSGMGAIGAGAFLLFLGKRTPCGFRPFARGRPHHRAMAGPGEPSETQNRA